MLFAKWLILFVVFIFIVAHASDKHHDPHAELHAQVKVCERKEQRS